MPGYSTAVGDEGGFAPALKKNSDAVELIIQAIERAGYTPGSQIEIAIDPASSGFYENGLYHLRSEGRKVDAQELISLYSSWVDKYPIAVLEDGLAEDDWSGWKLLNDSLGNLIELVGDDLFVHQRGTDSERHHRKRRQCRTDLTQSNRNSDRDQSRH